MCRGEIVLRGIDLGFRLMNNYLRLKISRLWIFRDDNAKCTPPARSFVKQRRDYFDVIVSSNILLRLSIKLATRGDVIVIESKSIAISHKTPFNTGAAV